MKEINKMNNLECCADATHSNLNNLNREKFVYLNNLVEKENTSTKENELTNNNNTSTLMPFTSAGLNNNVKDEQTPTKEEKVLENSLKQVIPTEKEKIQQQVEILLKRLAQSSTPAELLEKSHKFCTWLESKSDVINDNHQFNAYCDKAEQVYTNVTNRLTTTPLSSSGLNYNTKDAQTPTKEEKVLENSLKQVIPTREEKDELFTSIFSNPAAPAPKKKVEEKSKVMVRVIATGEIISVTDVIKKGLGVDDVQALTDDVSDVKDKPEEDTVQPKKVQDNTGKKAIDTTPPNDDYLSKIGNEYVRLGNMCVQQPEDVLAHILAS